VFVQTGVMSTKSTRDGRRQSRLVRGKEDGFEICTINHARGGEVRLDATVTFTDESHESVVYAHPSDDYDHDAWFSAYTPQNDDGCYVGVEDGGPILENAESNAKNVVCWWHMADGKVLGVHNGLIIEYDPSTLAPLGLVVAADELAGRQVAVIDSGLDQCDGAVCEEREQALILYDEEGQVTVVQPNEDGSYWRKIVRNKMVRMKEKRRETAAKEWVKDLRKDDETPAVVSSWGPYTSTVGTATKTGVQGVTVPVGGL